MSGTRPGRYPEANRVRRGKGPLGITSAAKGMMRIRCGNNTSCDGAPFPGLWEAFWSAPGGFGGGTAGCGEVRFSIRISRGCGRFGIQPPLTVVWCAPDTGSPTRGDTSCAGDPYSRAPEEPWPPPGPVRRLPLKGGGGARTAGTGGDGSNGRLLDIRADRNVSGSVSRADHQCGDLPPAPWAGTQGGSAGVSAHLRLERVREMTGVTLPHPPTPGQARDIGAMRIHGEDSGARTGIPDRKCRIQAHRRFVRGGFDSYPGLFQHVSRIAVGGHSIPPSRRRCETS